MLTAVIIDDEEDAISVLIQLLRDFTTIQVKIVGTAQNLEKGVICIKETKPDIVFLDIDMPQKSGMEIYNYFEHPSFKIIFVTAYSQYAIDALKKSATDYLLKPINFIELRDALKKISEGILMEQQHRELEDKINTVYSAEMEGKSIMLEVESGFVVENTKNIEYCYADQSYSVIVTFAGKKIIVSKSLKDLQSLLPAHQFYRTHKSFLVNIYYIRKFIKTKESYLMMKSGIKVPVSVRTSSVITKEIKKLLN